MKLQHLSAIALAVSTALTLTACGSEAETAYGLANSSNPLVQPSNTGNSNTSNADAADAADAVDNTGAGTNTNTNNTTPAPTTGTSSATSTSNPPTKRTGILTTATGMDLTVAVESHPRIIPTYDIRNSFLDDIQIAHAKRDVYTNHRIQAVSDYKTTIDNIDYPLGAAIAFSGEGYRDLPMTDTAKFNVDGKEHIATRESRVQLYQGANSMVLGMQTLSGQISDGSMVTNIEKGDMLINQLSGTPTPNDTIIALKNTFNYKGQAFSENGVGELTYTIDFHDKTGSGKITGLSDKGTINLNQAGMGNITHKNRGEGDPSPLLTRGIQGLAHFENGTKEGIYTLGIFGQNAEEVAGFVTEDGDKHTVGFGGKKQ